MSVLSPPSQPKPYYPYSQYLKDKFGHKIYKVTLDAGFTCPNIDGTKGKGGCSFCDETGSSSRAQDLTDSITVQVQKNVERQRKRFKVNKFVAYFQSHTNTYDSVDRLKAIYDEAMAAHEDIVGLAISTRPDSVDDEKLALIASYDRPDRHVTVEYGMQTIHDRSLRFVNRCETHADFVAAYELTRKYNLDHCVHIILGMPGETHDDMMATADRMAELKVNGVKIHMLVAMEKTPLARAFMNKRWQPMTQEEYILTCCDFLERLQPDCVIHRIAGNGHHEHVVAPLWMQRKMEVMTLVEQEFARRGTRQGSKCKF